MRAGLILLCIGYVLSQFFRSFLAVLTQDLNADLGATPDDLAMASSLWFVSFSLMQFAVGAALDRVGPRLTAAVLLFVGGAGGAYVFATAQTPFDVKLAMFLIGIGCSPILMGSYYIFARMYSPAVFASLAAIMIGVGSVGNLAGSVPLRLLVAQIGWRDAMMGLAAVSAITAVGLWVFIKNPPKVVSDTKGSVLDLLKMPALWLIFPLMFVQYVPAALMRGLWIGPYLAEVYGAEKDFIGTASMIMAVAMIAGTFAYGPLDRWFGTRKWVIFAGNFIAMLGCIVLGLLPEIGVWPSIALFSLIGLTGMTFPVIMAHGRAFAPAHLAGRGVTLMNFFAIGGVGVFQFISGIIYKNGVAQYDGPAEPFSVLFLFYAALMAVGLVIYLFSQDKNESAK